jgi:hypothetical protein
MARCPPASSSFWPKRFAVGGSLAAAATGGECHLPKLCSSGFEVFPVNRMPQRPRACAAIRIWRLYRVYRRCRSPRIRATLWTSFGNAVNRAYAKSGSPVLRYRQRLRRSGTGMQRRGIQCIVGGCPLMYCEPVDPAPLHPLVAAAARAGSGLAWRSGDLGCGGSGAARLARTCPIRNRPRRQVTVAKPLLHAERGIVDFVVVRR